MRSKITRISMALLGVLVLSRLLSFTIATARALNPVSLYEVDRLTDANPAGGGEGSGTAGDLRYAIANAQSGDGVTFRVTGTINLASALPSLNHNVTIQGPGASELTVLGSGGRVFKVSGGATVLLSGLTISGGYGNGAGIFNAGTLLLNEVTVSGNAAGDPANGGGTGSGIWNYLNATLILNNCTVRDNTAQGNLSYNPSRGAGIANYGSLTINNTTISDNAVSQGSGGGIFNIGTITLTNATVSGNSATYGGGLYFSTGSANLTNVTLSGNSAISGGGLFIVDEPATVTHLKNTLIANSPGGGNCGGKAVASSESTLSSDNTCALAGVGDHNNVDVLLTALGHYGGSTQVHMLQNGSPAIDGVVGDEAPPIDQRGEIRPHGNGYDIGAVEWQPADFESMARSHLPLVLR